MIKNTEIIIVEKSRIDLTLKFLIKKTKRKRLQLNIIMYIMEKKIIASRGRYELIKPNKLIILIEGTIYKKVIKTYMKCNNFPILWRTFFLKIANNRDYVYNFCN